MAVTPRREQHCAHCHAPAGAHIRRKHGTPTTWRHADQAQALSDVTWSSPLLVRLRPGRHGLCDHCWQRVADVVGDDEE